MTEETEQKKGILAVVRGGKTHIRGRRRGPHIMTREEMALDRRLRSRFAAVTDREGNVPGRPYYRVREHEQHPWRSWARMILHARTWGLSLSGREEMLLAIHEFGEWADEQLGSESGEFPRAA